MLFNLLIISLKYAKYKISFCVIKRKDLIKSYNTDSVLTVRFELLHTVCLSFTYIAWKSVAYRHDGFSRSKLHYRQCSKKSDDPVLYLS